MDEWHGVGGAILNSWNKVNSDRKKETVQTYNDQKQ